MLFVCRVCMCVCRSIVFVCVFVSVVFVCVSRVVRDCVSCVSLCVCVVGVSHV